jgi:hypothetical protein
VDIKKLKFSPGDLVVTMFPLELAFENYKIPEGSIGLVTSFINTEIYNISGYHYNVLVKGREVAFFERELIAYKSWSKK